MGLTFEGVDRGKEMALPSAGVGLIGSTEGLNRTEDRGKRNLLHCS